MLRRVPVPAAVAVLAATTNPATAAQPTAEPAAALAAGSLAAAAEPAAVVAPFPSASSAPPRPFGAPSFSELASEAVGQRPAASAPTFATAARVAAAIDATASCVAHCADRGDYRSIWSRWETAIRTGARAMESGHTPRDPL